MDLNKSTFIPFSQIIGQEGAIEFLKRVMAMDKIPHAYLFAGIPGIGKTTAAVAFTQALNCNQPINGEGCGQCIPCRQVINGNFPDYNFIEPDGTSIKIEQIRELTRKLSFKLVSGKYRVSIINRAETLTSEAGNSFLKTLEEPPPGNVLVLNVTEPRALLPTIVSRCQKIFFRPISVKLISRCLMDKKEMNEEQAGVLAKISEGSLEKALQMCDDDFFEKRQDILSKLAELPGLSEAQAFEMALEYIKKKKASGSSKKMDIIIFDLLSTWKTWYRDMLLIKVECLTDLLINTDFSQKLKNSSKHFRINSLIDSFFVLSNAQRDLLKNRNSELVMENTLLALKRLAGRKEQPAGFYQ